MRKCRHKWVKLDKDDGFKKEGRYEVKRVYEACRICREERIRKVRRRV